MSYHQSFIFTLLMAAVILTKPISSKAQAVKTATYREVRKALLEHREVAIIDVREEAIFAQSHPLFAVNISLSKIELEVYERIPGKNTFIVVYDNHEGLVKRATDKLTSLGYTDVQVLEGGLKGWEAAGGELFIDVNAPSKAFGEFVESKRHTPMLTAPQVKELIDKKEDIVIVDARRFDEYQTMSIPGSISVPGAELVLRIRELAPNPETKIIVNCAGRTRSIIGTQSLINAGIPNQVVALRNGTIGWTLAGQELEHGQSRHFGNISDENKERAVRDSRVVADKAGVKRVDIKSVDNWLKEKNRTTYRFDVRTPDEFVGGHVPGFSSVPGGQLVQETDHYAAVRGARIVLVDDQAVRANMTASWLAQMGWDVSIVDGLKPEQFSVKGYAKTLLPPFPVLEKSKLISVRTLSEWLKSTPSEVVVVDLASSKQFSQHHIPGARFAIRSDFTNAVAKLPAAAKYVLTSSDGSLARFAKDDLQSLTKSEVYVLDGGTKSWIDKGYALEKESTDKSIFASGPIDRYKRPYEGTNNAVEAMEAYLQWEYGLVDQLAKDGTHGFFVVE